MSSDWHWSDSALPGKIFDLVDARALIPILIAVIKWSQFTFYMGLSGVVLGFILAQFGFTPMALVRYVRLTFVTTIAGPVRPGGDPGHLIRRRAKIY